MVPNPRLRAQTFFNFFLLGSDKLNFDSVRFFDWAITLKIDPFPHKGVMPYTKRLDESKLYAVSGWY